MTVTHPEMRRFFMLIPEAVQLVLHAAAQAEHGVTYVLEMGEQVKLVDMARDVIRLSGLVPDEDISIKFIGLRPGEKLHEELVGSHETVGPSMVDNVLRVTSRTKPTADMLAGIAQVEDDAVRGSTQSVLDGIKNLIPEFGSAAGPCPLAPSWKRRYGSRRLGIRSPSPSSSSSALGAIPPVCTVRGRGPSWSARAGGCAPFVCSSALTAIGAGG